MKALQSEKTSDISNKLGISPSYASLIKWGKRIPPLQLALKIQKIYKIPVNYWEKK